MLAHSNIDRLDSVQVSKAPFTYESTLNMAGNIVPSGSILSLKVYTEYNDSVPFRFHSIKPDGRLAICDKYGAIVAYWQTYATTEPGTEFVSSLLYNPNGVIAGHISCDTTLVNIIRNVVDSLSEDYFFPADAFVLIPQCHVAMLTGKGRSIRVISQGQRIADMTGSFALQVSGCVLKNGNISLSITNTANTIKENAPHNGLCKIQVPGQQVCDCGDCSVIIKAGSEDDYISNLRVVRENGSIVFKGVLDA